VLPRLYRPTPTLCVSRQSIQIFSGGKRMLCGGAIPSLTTARKLNLKRDFVCLFLRKVFKKILFCRST